MRWFVIFFLLAVTFVVLADVVVEISGKIEKMTNEKIIIKTKDGSVFEIPRKLVKHIRRTSIEDINKPVDICRYIWYHFFRIKESPTEEELKDLAKYFVKNEKRFNYVKTLILNKALSIRQKRIEFRRNFPYVFYGIITTNKKEYKGLIYFTKFYKSITEENGGWIEISPYSIKEITIEKIIKHKVSYSTPCWAKVKIKKHDGKIFQGVYSLQNIYIINQKFVIEIKSDTITRIIFQGYHTVECPDCFKTMEIDWKFCPYCGRRLDTK